MKNLNKQLNINLYIFCMIFLIQTAYQFISFCDIPPDVIIELGAIPSGTNEQIPGHVLKMPQNGILEEYFVARRLPPNDPVDIPPCLTDLECSHEDRDFNWQISGGDYQILGTKTLSHSTQKIHIRFTNSSEYTINCIIGDLIPTGIYCPSGHTGDHTGGIGNIKITPWYVPDHHELDLRRGDSFCATIEFDESITLLDPDLPPPYDNMFAFEWSSATSFWPTPYISPAPIFKTNGENNTSSWGGRIVTDTIMFCSIRIMNHYTDHYSISDNNLNHTIQFTINITPRSGWINPLLPYHNETPDTSWQANSIFYYPERTLFIAYGVNTNDLSNYECYPCLILTPNYYDQSTFSNDYNSFTENITAIDNGPNESLWFNTNPSIHHILRKGLYNFWVTPIAWKPIDLNFFNHPYFTLGQDVYYWNWLSLQSDFLGGHCACSDPAYHGGNSVHARWHALINHEMFGPELPLGRLDSHYLGHQAELIYFHNYMSQNLFEITFENLVGNSLENLRYRNNIKYNNINTTLYSYMGSLVHNYLSNDPAEHNFSGNLLIYEDNTPAWQHIPAPFSGNY